MSDPEIAGLSGLVALIEERAGVMVPDRDLPRLEELVRARLRSLPQRGLTEYVQLLRSAAGGPEWRELLGRLTIKESSLFRGPQQFRALAEQVLPQLIRRRPSRRLRLWSAGCARGEEAATLAAILAEQPTLTGWDWRVLATDVDESALEVARMGRFGRRAVEKVPDGVLQRRFRAVADRWVLRRELLDRIDFRALNLIESPYTLPEATFDVVLLRNVLIYFREDAQERVVAAVAEHLAEDGVLLVGPTESLLRLATGLEPVDLGDCFVYRHAVRAAPPQSAPPPAPSPPTVSPAPPDSPGTAPPEPRPDPAEEGRAALREGRTAHAVEMAERAAEARPEDAEVRALLGISRERAGETEEAIRAYRATLYLDPALVQVRYLLAECLSRRGWTARARAELREILASMRSGEARPLDGGGELGLPDLEELADRCRRALGPDAGD